MAYSPFFQVLHDERAPVGNLGRGTHYSVVRTALPVLESADPESVEEQIFEDARRRQLQFFDLAIIWDEDHDERIWGVIERLYVGGLLAPVRFIGERKGSVTLICDDRSNYGTGGFDRYSVLAAQAARDDRGDEWDVHVHLGVCGDCSHIINADDDRVIAYLRGIQATWNLGPSPWRFQWGALELV
ncbi:hypothetical protein [Ramlibacter sp. AN1133]|uniref:hypothetical protein n=1 Tax=Ramlibacter sp. AN1133 TaxID=3133429 RepID=UPI0030C2E686